MAKLDKAALKAQGDALKAHLAMARKRQLNFAILQGKDGLVVEADPKKNPAMMRKQAKSNGGGPKGTQGLMTAEGKTLILTVEDEPPGNFPKLIRQHFMSRGVPIKILIKLPGGGTMEDGEDDGDGGDGAPQFAGDDGDTQGAGSGSGPLSGDDGDGGGDTPVEDKPDTGDKTAELLAKAYQIVAKEMGEKIDDAEDGIKNALKQAEEGFKRAMQSKEFEAAKAMLSQMKKAIAKIQPKSFFEELVEDVKEGIEDVGEVLSDVKEKAEEVIEDVQEKVEDVLHDIGDKIGILSENDKKQKEKLKDLDLSEDQELKLVQLARKNPKAFEAALDVMKQMDAKHGDLDPTPEGLKKAREEADQAAKDLKAAEALEKQLKAKLAEAKKAADEAKTAALGADNTYKATQQALQNFKDSMPADPSKLSEEARNKLVAEMNKLINANEDAKKAREAAVQKAKDEKGKQDAAAQAVVDQGPKTQAAKDKKAKEEEQAKAAQAKKDMLDSLSMGALSPDAKNPMSDEDIAKVVGAFNVDPAFGQKALELVNKSGDRANLADGIDRLTKGLGNGFKDKDGNAYGDADAQRKYAEQAMSMGAAMGGDYFAKMDKFIEGGGLNKPDPISLAGVTTFKKLEQKRAAYVGGAMVNDEGKIDPTGAKAQEALDMMNFHPGTLRNATPGMNMHFADMAKTMDDPKHKQKCQDVLDGITTAPTSVTGQKLVAKALGKAPGDVTADDVKGSVMSAMFTPLDQGPVGSCFATGPARRVMEENPAKAMGHMSEIALTGKFTTAQGQKVNAIKTEKLPGDDNQLMRSFEYTVATAGAILEDSSQRETLKDNLFNGPNGLNGIKGKLPDQTKWPAIRAKLQTALVEKLTFRYDPSSEIGGSNDGSSTKGNFQIIDKSTNKAILTKEDFIKVITRLALEAAEETKDTETGGKIVDLCKSDSFINAVCPGKYKPWELPGGGRGYSSSKVLNGGEPTDTPMSEDNWKKVNGSWEKIDPPGKRTEKILTDMMGRFVQEGPESKMLDLRTTGIHAFGGLPNHPSLAPLKEGGDPAKAIEKHILKPAEEMAKTDLSVEKTGMLFDQQLDTMAGWKLFSGGAALLETARTKRPTEAMKPKELKDYVDEVTKDLRDYMATERAKEWKKKQEDAGKVVNNAAFNKKVASLKETVGKWSDDEFSNNIIDNLEPPQFVIADTNWGNKDGHTFFVVIPDPVSGQPKMFKRKDPSGELTELEQKWLDTSWQVTE